MNAYVDTSFLISVVFEESDWRECKRTLERCEGLYASELLVAEALSAAKREGVSLKRMAGPLGSVTRVLPDRTIQPEFKRVLQAGYLRGADLWHLACACYLAPSASDLAFLTRDEQQQKVARSLGFSTP